MIYLGPQFQARMIIREERREREREMDKERAGEKEKREKR